MDRRMNAEEKEKEEDDDCLQQQIGKRNERIELG